MQLHDVVTTSMRMAETRSRTAKTDLLAGLLERARDQHDEVELAVVTTWLGGTPRQRRTGLGWRSLSNLPEPAESPTLTLRGVDAALTECAELSGSGSQSRRAALVAELFGATTAEEQQWLRALVLGNLRQGALDSAVQAAVARVAEVAVSTVRRAAMLAGSTAPAAQVALAAENPEAADLALAAFRLQVGRAVQPMLAASAPDVATAFASTATDGGALIDAKLDGIRLQVHRRDGVVRAFTRSLDEITDRLPAVVRLVEELPGGDLVLDAEALVRDDDGRPVPFQETASATGTQTPDGGERVVRASFFDLLHREGRDLMDEPLALRLVQLGEVVGPEHRTDCFVAHDPDEAEAFARQVLAHGHEGVVVKDLTAPYAAGRRGGAWVKVKPVHTLDLVVLAVEHGSGRRRGWLSNLHLGARDPATGEFVMVGKTFKGMTDEMLRWQTERFRELATHEDQWTVHVRPEQVVEIAVDGVQRSSRYPGGVALRFARVVGYRHDKTADQADTIDTVRGLGSGD